MIASLALGIGANTAIFSIVNALLLRPLPVSDADRLATVSSTYALAHGFKAGAGMSYALWTRFAERLHDFDGGFAWASSRVDLSEGGERQPAEALFASGGFFPTLRVRPLLGRTFTSEDDVRGGGRDGLVAVIGYGFWQRHFSGTAEAIGAELAIEGVRFTIIGVMPPEFFGLEVGLPFDVAIPLATEPSLRAGGPSLHDPRAYMLTVMLRLKPGQSRDGGTAAVRTIQTDIVASLPTAPEFVKDPYVLVAAATGTSDRSGLRRRYVRPLLTALAIVVAVLLVACVNIANLLLARAAARRHEWSVRVALGASRWRLARQLLLESLVLSTLGAGLGLLVARWAGGIIVGALDTSEQRVLLDLSLDWRVLATTVLLLVATALFAGLAPAVRTGRVAPVEALAQNVRAGDRSSGLFGGLVVVQVAVSMILLVTAALFLTTLARLMSAPLGFEGGPVLVVDVDTTRAQIPPDNRIGYQQQLVDALAAVPGVAQTAASSFTPFSRPTRSPLFSQPDRVHEQAVTPDFFTVYGMPLRAGRSFDRRDNASAPRVAIVSEAYARKFFRERNPLGQAIDRHAGCQLPRGGPCTVVGVVGDALYSSARASAPPMVYVPHAQSEHVGLPGRTSATLSLRAVNDSPAALAPSVAAAINRVDPRLSFTHRTLLQDVNDTLVEERILARLSSLFASLGLLLSMVGLFGVVAYSVVRRRKELGIRIALGASSMNVMRAVLARTVVLVVCGLLLGSGLSLWLSTFFAALLYDLHPGDPSTLLAAGLTLAATAALASIAPALRAVRLDPAEVLRQN